MSLANCETYTKRWGDVLEGDLLRFSSGDGPWWAVAKGDATTDDDRTAMVALQPVNDLRDEIGESYESSHKIGFYVTVID